MTDKPQVNPEPEASTEKREAARLRKQKQRSREKVEKIQAVLEEKKGSVSNEEWWDLNRKTLSVKQRQEMLAREEEVGGLIVMMMSYLTYAPEDDEDREILRELIEKVKRDVQKHGLSASRAMSIPNLCRTHTQLIQGDNSPATRDAVMFGFLTGIPSQLHADFMLKFTTNTAKCMMPGCSNPQGNLEIWFCNQHALDRANTAKAHRGAAPIPLEDRLYTVNGRLYPSGEI